MAEVHGAKAVSLGFRIVALGLSVAAAVVMGTASQCVYYVAGAGDLCRVVSYNNYSAFVYVAVAGVISAVCTALALYLSVYRASHPAVTFLDVVAQALLYSAAAAAFAVRGVATWDFLAGAGAGDLGADAAALLGRGSVCRLAGAFCWKVSTAATISACAAAAVSVAVLTKDAGGGGGSGGDGGHGGSGGSCKHGCHS